MENAYMYLGAALSVGLSGLGVAIGQGIMTKKAVEYIGGKKDAGFFLTVTILGLALIETAVIYGLVVAFQIFSLENLSLAASIGAGVAIGFSGFGAGVGEGYLILGALNAIHRNPQIKTKLMTFMILFLALVEVTAIYGLIISFKILSLQESFPSALGAGLAVGLAGLGVTIGEGLLGKRSLEAMSNQPGMLVFFLTITILGMALVETAGIYGLVVAFKILSLGENLGLFASIGAGCAIGLTGLGAGWGEGKLLVGALLAIERNSSIKGKLMTFMILFLALVEVTAIYGLIIAFKILGYTDVDSLAFIGAGLAIGFAGLGVAVGRGFLSEESLIIFGKNPKVITFFLMISILGVALVETAAIYGLIVAFKSFSFFNEVEAFHTLVGGIAIGLTGLGAGIGEGIFIKGALHTLNIVDENRGKVITIMILFVALIEVVAIYGLFVAFKMLF